MEGHDVQEGAPQDLSSCYPLRSSGIAPWLLPILGANHFQEVFELQ